MKHVLHATLGACAAIALALTIGFATLGATAGKAEAQTPAQCSTLYAGCMTTTPVPDYCARGLATCSGGQAPAAPVACSAPYMQCLSNAKSMARCTATFRSCIRK